MSELPPSGRQVQLEAHGQTAVVVEAGGGIREWRVGGRDALDGYPQQEACTAARGLPLVPWPNRLLAGRYTWDGVTYELPVNEPAKHAALHGLARHISWQVLAQEGDRATLGVTLWPRDAWPFLLSVSVEYVLGPAGLTVTTVAENSGDVDAPWAAGAHPYLTVGTPTVDTAELHLAARSYLPTDKNQQPTGVVEVAGTGFDFRSGRALGDTVIDHAFTDLARGPDGLAGLTLRNPGDGRELALWVDGAYDYLEVFTGDTVPQPARRRQGLGVEPMTAPPNAYASGTGLVRLQPGGVHTARWGIRPTGW